jgi:hypothetical protein
MAAEATVTGSEQLLSAQTMTGNGEAITEASDVGDSPFRELTNHPLIIPFH